MEIRCLGPGTELPSWVEELDRATFGSVWGRLECGEILLVLGKQAFLRWRLIPAAGEAELLRIAVAPAVRRQGLARRLLGASEPILRRQKIFELHLEVRTSNKAARTLYEAQGWRFQSIRKAYYRDGEDAAVYARKLDA